MIMFRGQWTVYVYEENVWLQGENLLVQFILCLFVVVWVIQGQMGWLLWYSPQGFVLFYIF